MICTLLLLSCGDTESRISTQAMANDFQTVIMKEVFKNQSSQLLLVIKDSDPNKPVCGGWMGVRCYSSIVREVSYFSFIMENMCIEYLPPTVSGLTIIGCRQKFQLQTRHFPREAESISLKTNQIYGSVDMVGLPRKIRRLDLSNNRIGGPIQLCPLPPQMTRLDVSANRIRQETVYYHNLPESIEFIGLYGNSIQRIEAYIEEEKLANDAIFRVNPEITA